MLHHYVFIKYQNNTPDEHVAKFCSGMLNLRNCIPLIEHLEIGRDILHDDRSWDLVLIMRFASIETLRDYQQHPEHRKLMAFNQPLVANVASIDFEHGMG